MNPGSSLTANAPVLDSSGRAIGWTTQQTAGGSAGLTTYVICADVTAVSPTGTAFAPSNVAAAVGNFDSGPQSDDVRLSFTTPATNVGVSAYGVENAFLGAGTTANGTNCTLGATAPNNDTAGIPASAAFATAGVANGANGVPLTFTAFDLAAGGYCFRVVAQDPMSGIRSYSNYVSANVAAAPALTVTPQYAANEDNEASQAVPGIGQHTYTFQTTLTGTLSFAVVPSGFISRISDGSYGFCDFNQDSKADNVGTEQAFITAVNGSPVGATNKLVNQPIPANGTITVTVDSSIRNERVRIVAWQDLNHNGQIDLSAAGDVNCDFANQATNNTTVDGAMIVSGRKFWFGPNALFGAQNGGTNCATNAFPLYRHDAANQVFGAGPKSGDQSTAGSISLQGKNSLRYNYDSNDIFQIFGTQVSLATFKNELTGNSGGSGDTLVIAYDPNPAGISTFNICVDKGADAPSDLTAVTGNFDAGPATDDVRLTFTSPGQNVVLTFTIQRATKDASNNDVTPATCTPGASPNPNGSSATPPHDGSAGNPPNANFATVGSATANGGFEQQTFNDLDLANGSYCYRVLVTNPNTGINSYSNYVFVTVVAAPAPFLAITTAFSGSEDNEVSAAIPGTGQHTYTVNTTLIGTLNFAIIPSPFATQNTNGSYGFCDTNRDHAADMTNQDSMFTSFSALNGSPVTPSQALFNVLIPANGVITVTVDSATRNQRVRVVVWQDLNHNGQIDLPSAGDVFCDAYTTYDPATEGFLAVSGRKFYFGPEGSFGSQFANACVPIWRQDSVNQVFSASPQDNNRGRTNSLRYAYDSNDVFQILGATTTLATFKAELSAAGNGTADAVQITYDPNPAGVSTFNICVNRGADAPADLAATVGTFDTGPTNNDVRLTFTSPGNNTVLTFSVQRAALGAGATCSAGASPNPNGSSAPPHDGSLGSPASGSFSTIGTAATPGSGEQATFTDFNISGSNCYRVLAVNPNTGVNSYSNYVLATIAAPPPALGGITVSPNYPVNEDNEVSTTVPGIGQHTYTFTTTLSGTLSFAVMPSFAITPITDGSYGFCDLNQDSTADSVGTEQVFITAVNGTPITATNLLRNQAIPSSGTITITIDSAIRNDRVRLVAWQDLNNNGQIDLSNAGDVDCDFATQATNNTTVDGAMIVSGRKFYFGPSALFGAQNGGTNCATNAFPVYRHDPTNQVFGAGPKSGDFSAAGSVSLQGKNSLRYSYDSNDTFQILGTQVTLATFKSELTTSTSGGNDQLVISYDPNPAGISTFNICVNRGADAPTDLAAAVGNFDGGTSAEDVRLTFTSPSQNTVLTFNIQRASKDASGANLTPPFGPCTPGGSPNPNGSSTTPPSDGTFGNPPNSAFTTIGSVIANGTGEQQTFTDFDVSTGSYCYRVQVSSALDGLKSYSNYVLVTVTGGAPGDTIPPTSTSAFMSVTGGLAFTLDAGDRLIFDFSEQMSVAPNALIRVTDSDCGPATNAGAALCSGGQTNTVADIVCGSNATCNLQAGPFGPNTELAVVLTFNPTIIAAGSVTGAELPVVVTTSSGITDLSGNQWNLAASPDRLIEPPGAVGGPLSTSATLTSSGGFANTLDLGDTVIIDFNQVITILFNAVIRLIDSDCGLATSAGPAPCSGGNTNTIADIVCGSNATCAVQAGPAGPSTELMIVMFANPSIVSPGSTSGAQFPVVVTDSSGVTSTSGAPWNLPASPDRAFGPQGQ